MAKSISDTARERVSKLKQGYPKAQASKPPRGANDPAQLRIRRQAEEAEGVRRKR